MPAVERTIGSGLPGMSDAAAVRPPLKADPVAPAFAMLAAAALAIALLPVIAAVPATIVLGTGGLALLQRSATGRWPTISAGSLDVVAMLLFGLARRDAFRIWQIPSAWFDVMRLTATGAALMVVFYCLAAAAMLLRARRHIAGKEVVGLLLLPLLFNLLLLLGSDVLMNRLGFWLTAEAAIDDRLRGVIGRAVVLIGFVELLILALRGLVAGRLPRDARLHLLLVGMAIHAAITPLIADVTQGTAAIGAVGQILLAVATAALAQSGLWALTFVVTGLAIDALSNRPPTFAVAWRHWRSGLVKGAIYGGVFIGLLLVAALMLRTPFLVAALLAVPALTGIVGGALLFPLAATVVASADGTAPFFGRLADAYRQPRGYARGAVVGLGVALAFVLGLPEAEGGSRFLVMAGVGALAYGGVDFALDLAERAAGRRPVRETWRVYVLGLGLGAFVGGSLGWYFDGPQVGVVVAKFWAYATLVAEKPTPFMVYPLFNKFGAMDLGQSGGGVRLFFNESLSGVINWGIAAPLFSINYFVLAALLSRSLSPLKQLISAQGFISLVEQTVRVLRWGLWMAPVINSFLRQSPDPSWYNQDGLVRTVAASGAQATLPPDSFRTWSLSIFTGLLAYDWLRIAIWFDHMGLRVATLVNLTFLGGDKLDEAAARFVGHSARTRVVPVGIRRFATWAPLLIPFYIPHGPDWDTAWTGAEQIRAQNPPMTMAVDSIVAVYGLAAVALCMVALAVGARWDRRRPPASQETQALPDGLARTPSRFALSNGFAGSVLMPDGRGWLSVEGSTRNGHALDITKQVTDPMQLRGPFLYLRDADAGLWSAGFEPMRTVGPDYTADQPTPNCARIRHTYAGIAVEVETRLAEEEPIEFQTLVLRNTGTRPRRLRLVSFRELGAHEPGGYMRDPDFAALHVQTWFVAGLQGVFARNRLLRQSGRMSPELMFHAVRLAPEARLVGYEDSRTRFAGHHGLRDPHGVKEGRARSVEDQGSLYTFDPAASLTVAVELPPGGRCELVFVSGWGRDEAAAVALVASHIGAAAGVADAVAPVWDRVRAIEPLPLLPASTWPFAFTPAGDALHLTFATPRPWAHVLANANGFGTVVSNEGEIHSFNGNARQNALTPFRFEPVPTTNPGQLVYVVDLDTGAIDTPGFLPFRDSAVPCSINYALGSATFIKTRPETELSLTVFVLPDGPADMRILTIRNRTARDRRFRVVPYFDMALAESAEDSVGKLVAERDETTEALLFHNPTNDFQQGWAFVTTSLTAAVSETVRNRFLGGAGRDLADPFMVAKGVPETSRDDDGRRVAAFSGVVDVPANGESDVVIVLGQTATRLEAVTMAAGLRDPATARSSLAATQAWWAERLNDIQVETNDPGFDRLVNHWLPYQALASRLWGRNGPNQRGGAYGFRDQLQDVLPFLFFDPNLTRRQIVFHAGAQFTEGDVFKWWHIAPDGRSGLGQRTRASDPHLWLPYVLTRYVEATGDTSVLDERAAFIEGPPVPDGVVDLLIAARQSLEVGDVYDHCRRAIDYALARFGPHGLPLVGTGDWNDGIDAAGSKGRGESLWLSFFLHDVLRRFTPLVAEREGEAAATAMGRRADALRDAIATAWTGDHFVFDYTDDGRILDHPSIMTAAWPALSGAVAPERALQALDHGLAALGKPDRILLLTPPFDERSDPYPGRIADYPPGVRENGGQYSHGASWTVDAFVELARAASERGDAALAATLRERAFEAWRAISPLGKTEGDALAVYGLSPAQQPADIYDGEGYAGRGGWSWYTGSAARMLSAAYAVIGLTMRDGHVEVPDNLFEPRGALQIRRLTVKRRTWRHPDDEEPLREAAQ